MSYTTLYSVPEKGSIESIHEFSNASGSAMYIWNQLYQKYLPQVVYFLGDDKTMDALWKLIDDKKLKPFERICLGFTFDRVMVKRENISKLISAFKDFHAEAKINFPQNVCHLPDQIKELELLEMNEDIYAVCWCQTSVASDVWYVPEGECKECGHESEEQRLWDISLDKGHFFLFEQYDFKL